MSHFQSLGLINSPEHFHMGWHRRREKNQHIFIQDVLSMHSISHNVNTKKYSVANCGARAPSQNTTSSRKIDGALLFPSTLGDKEVWQGGVKCLMSLLSYGRQINNVARPDFMSRASLMDAVFVAPRRRRLMCREIWSFVYSRCCHSVDLSTNS